MSKKVVVVLVACALAVLGVVLSMRSRGTSSSEVLTEEPGSASAEIPSRHRPLPETPSGSARDEADAADGTEASAESDAEVEAEEEAQTEEEKREAAEEKLVEDFDNLTDRWMEPAEKGVSMADVEAFVSQFKKVPKDRQEECLQRALNLVPDENVMLLAGVLMDKDQPKELVELVFNDILNRDEDVKKPILQQVYKDKKHPCWADTAWIFDVTGEKSD